jgi:hypothetical protein
MRLPISRIMTTPINQGTGCDPTTSSPFLRLSLVRLAIDISHKRSAALPPRTLPNQAGGTAQDITALRRALRNQMTPSCCTHLLKRLVPGFWAVVTTHTLSPEGRVVLLREQSNNMGRQIGLREGAWAVWMMCRARACTFNKCDICHALGE